MRRLGLALYVVVAACGGSTAVRKVAAPDPEPIIESLAPPLVFGPVTAPASTYNEPTSPTAADPTVDAVWAGLAELARGRGIVTRDGRLDVICRELAPVAARGAPLTEGLVEFALREHGVVEAAALTVSLRGASPDELLAALTARLGDSLFHGNVRIGLGGVDPLVVIVTYTPAVTLVGVPRQVDAHGAAEVRAMLAPGFHNPRVSVTREDGVSERLPISFDAPDAIRARFECKAHEATYWLVVEANTETDTDRALVPIRCGPPASAIYQLEPATNLVTTDPERRLIALINRERAARQLPLLSIDPRANAAARRYAALMASERSIEHTLGRSTLTERLEVAGLVPPMAFETTMHVESLARAAEQLLNLPGYRANIVDPRPTRAGIAIAPDANGGMYIAIEYVQVVPPIDVQQVARTLRERLHAGMPRMMPTGVLTHAATWYAERRSRGWDAQTIQNAFWREFSLGSLGVLNVSIVALSLDEVRPTSTFGRSIRADFGIGVAQSARDGIYAGRIWVVLLMGTPRERRR